MKKNSQWVKNFKDDTTDVYSEKLSRHGNKGLI